MIPLAEGHNDIEARRINIVMVRTGFPADVDWLSLAKRLLSWDGPTPVTLHGDRPFGLAWGPFAVEPIKSHRQTFNVWAYAEPAPTPYYYTNEGHKLPVKLPDAVVVHMAWKYPHGGVAFEPYAFMPPQLPVAGTSPFFGLTIPIHNATDHQTANVLTHELGHALFMLPDEYVGEQNGYDGRPNRTHYPSCAASAADARALWGDLMGQVDPFFDEWAARMTADGFLLPAEAAQRRADITVGYVAGGCYGGNGTVRATKGGLMFDQNRIPVFGSVNRRWVEKVLAVWSPTPH